MNNAAIILKVDSVGDEIEDTKKEERFRKVVRSLGELQKYVHFQVFVREVIGQDIERAELALETEDDEKEIYRLQGRLKILKKYKDLKGIEKNYKSQLTRINGHRENKQG